MRIKMTKVKGKDQILIEFKENGTSIRNIFDEIVKVLVKFVDQNSRIAVKFEDEDILVLDGKYLDLLRQEDEDELDKLLGGNNESQKDK